MLREKVAGRMEEAQGGGEAWCVGGAGARGERAKREETQGGREGGRDRECGLTDRQAGRRTDIQTDGDWYGEITVKSLKHYHSRSLLPLY